jgi:L-alanine-DL-glutamate epimerase-like enolase superfamily enzyme
VSRIIRASATLLDLEVETERTDAVQAFLSQETLVVDVETDDGLRGTGYSYTIGTGGRAVHSMLVDHLLPLVVGADATRVEHLWRQLYASTRATTVGAITSLALAAVDTAVWDVACHRAGLPLWRLAGGAQERVPLYDTEGGWLHLPVEDLVAGALDSRRRGLRGVKVKIGKPDAAEDVERIAAVRDAVGPGFAVMVDANQSMTLAESRRRARLLEPFDLGWIEEPMPASDLPGHAALTRSSTTPIAVGESLYDPAQFWAYLQAGAASVLQADVARVGGITPWLKVAHMAEAANVPICPHFLMELHVSLSAAVPNGRYVEHIPQLRAITREAMRVEDGHAVPSDAVGLGIAWDRDAMDDRRLL